MSRFRRRLMGLAALRQAKADDFVRVEYIQNPSRAYINTLYRPSNNTSVEVKLKYIENIVQWKFVYGVEQPTYRFSFLKTYAGPPFRFDFGTTTNMFNYELVLNQLMTIKQDRNKLYIDDVLIGESTYTSTFRTPYNLYIFTCNQKGKINDVYNNQQIRLYGFKIWENNVLIRDYIPMYQISKDTYGLWDRVEEKFYTSPNGVKFIGGHQIIYDAEIEYLQNNGNSYIDTQIECTSDLKVQFEGMVTTNVNRAAAGSIAKVSGSVYFRHHWSPNANNFYWIQRNSSSYASINHSVSLDTWYDVTIDPSNGTALINGVSDTFSKLANSYTTNENYCIFSRSDGQGRPSKFKSFKCWRDGVLLRDLIPVRVGNVGYMYDKVSNKLFGNNGSGSFILGQDTVVYDKI